MHGTAAWRPRRQRTMGTAPESKPFDEPGLDQRPVEAARLGTIAAAVEQASAALEDALLLGEGGIERHARRLLHDQRQVGRVEHVEGRAKRDRLEVDGIDRIVGRVVARIEPQQPLTEIPRVERRLDQMLGEIRLMVAIADDEKLLAWEIALEAAEERLVVALAHRLAAQIFVDLGHCIAGVAPVRGRQVLAERIVPGEMVRGQINVKEHRSAPALLFDHARGSVEIELIRLEDVAAERLAIDEILDADAFVVRAGSKESAVDRIDGVGAVAATLQGPWQPALDPAGRDAGHEELEAAVGARRQAREHVVFGVPAWPSGTLDQELARLAVE